MIDIVQAVAKLDEDAELHCARLLVLLDAFGEEDGSGQMQGLTKLAKLDFLLRYPTMLERALQARRKTTRDVKVEDHERDSVESQMVRYRFGPWDHRYREFLNVLVARELAIVSIDVRTVVIQLTAEGRSVARELAGSSLLEPYARRSAVLKRHIDRTATNLMRFIYKTFPEITTLRANEPIQP